jgi:hypothetical protein
MMMMKYGGVCMYPLLLNNVLLVRTKDHRNTRCLTPAVICLT